MIAIGFFVFIAASVLGWLWEVFLNIVICGCYVNRGILYGPWLPIYGVGAVLVLFIAYNVNNPMQIFFISAATCGILEYATSYIMEIIWGMRWWNYGGDFNVHGRINLLVILLFGIIGLLFEYIIVPNLVWINDRLAYPSRYITIIIFGIIAIDFIYAQINPNIASISTHRPL